MIRVEFSLLFIVTQQQKPFSTVLLFTLRLSAALEDIYAENFQPLPSFDNKMKTFNFFVSFGVFLSSTCVENIQPNHVRLFVSFTRDGETFYHTKPPRKYCWLIQAVIFVFFRFVCRLM